VQTIVGVKRVDVHPLKSTERRENLAVVEARC